MDSRDASASKKRRLRQNWKDEDWQLASGANCPLAWGAPLELHSFPLLLLFLSTTNHPFNLKSLHMTRFKPDVRHALFDGDAPVRSECESYD